MFRFEVIVDDKKLSYVLWALTGHCVRVSTPQPLVNAAIQNGSITAKTSGDSIDRLKVWCHEHKLKTVNAKNIKEFCIGNGLSVQSYSNMITRAKEAGVLKKRRVTGTKGKWEYEVKQ
jgi:hypothetical protein